MLFNKNSATKKFSNLQAMQLLYYKSWTKRKKEKLSKL